jgi:hypothetical protein
MAEELRLNMVTKTKYDADQKGKNTTYSLMICVMIISKCQGHECNFTRAASHAYK